MDLAKRRALRQWGLTPIVVITIGLGWKFPLIGLIVPVVMVTGIIGAFSNGRYVCGNICPRGAFLDRVVRHISPGRAIPHALRSPRLRWGIATALMSFMIWRLAQDIGNIQHWGMVFWQMCVITTAAALVLAVIWRPRAWCTVCPLGTIQNAIGGARRPLRMNKDACVGCRKCDRVCPMNLAIAVHRDDEQHMARDCIKCGECVAACPKHALSLGHVGKATDH